MSVSRTPHTLLLIVVEAGLLAAHLMAAAQLHPAPADVALNAATVCRKGPLWRVSSNGACPSMKEVRGREAAMAALAVVGHVGRPDGRARGIHARGARGRHARGARGSHARRPGSTQPGKRRKIGASK